MKGKIKIRKGNENHAPCVVFVSHFNTNFEYWICEELNTGHTFFSNENDLIDFNYKEYKRMYYSWKIDNQDIVKERFQKLLNEFQ